MDGTVNDSDLLVSRHSDLLNANKTMIQQDDDRINIGEGAKKRFVRFFHSDNFNTQSYERVGCPKSGAGQGVSPKTTG